jgi:hypothetical protein
MAAPLWSVAVLRKLPVALASIAVLAASWTVSQATASADPLSAAPVHPAAPVAPAPPSPLPPVAPPSGTQQPGPVDVTPGGTPGIDVPPDAVGATVDMRLAADGSVAVTETVTVPAGRTVTRTAPLRQDAGDNLERIFTVRDVSTDNGATVDVGGDHATLRFPAGRSVARYTVLGTVSDIGGGLEMHWQASGGWDTDLAAIAVSLSAPATARTVTCLAGPVGSSTACSLSQLTSTRRASAEQQALRQGDRVDFAVGLAAGAVAADAQVNETFSLARAFRLTPVAGIGLAVLLVALLGGGFLLLRARGRDAAALRTDADDDYSPLVGREGRVAFASPDGVLPGQIGTVVDEHVDPIDIAATVLDLAVRNYLWITEIAPPGPAEGTDGEPGPAARPTSPGAPDELDWLLVRRSPADDALRPYERAVYDAVLGEDDAVPVSALQDRLAPRLGAIRAALYADVVSSGWFQRRPDVDRSRAGLAGLVLTAAGVLATGLLAAFTTEGLLGLALIVAGVALTSAARAMPARTARGSALLARIVVLRDYLHRVRSADLPEADRELVFGRSLPYAVVLRQERHWLATFADLDPAADGVPGLHWYERHDGAPDDLRWLAGRFPALLTALEAALARAGHLRRLRPATPAARPQGRPAGAGAPR